MPSMPPPAPDAQPPHRIDPRIAAWDEGYAAGIEDGDCLRYNPYHRQVERDNLAALLDEFEAKHGPVCEVAVGAALEAWIRCSECGQSYTVTRKGTRIHNNCPGRPWNRNEVDLG